MSDTATSEEAARAPAQAAGAAAPPPKIKTGAGLWWPRAALQSFFNWSIDFYPRLSDAKSRKSKTVAVDAILRRLGDTTATWTSLADGDDKTIKSVLEKIVAKQSADAALIEEARTALAKPAGVAIDEAIDLAKASLAEVKEQTEYQDQKATRLLTVTTFLSALSGALFASFAAAYPLRMLQSSTGWEWWALLFAYVSFLLFVLAAIGGALITFHATRTRFKYPEEATVENQAANARSFLFFREIIGVSPEAWAGSFVTQSGGATQLRADLKREYLKNYVFETYLIAAKTADKLRYLGPGQSLLAWALRCLLVFVLLIALIQALVPRLPSEPAEIRLVQPAAPIPAEVRLVPTVAPPPATAQQPPAAPRPERRRDAGRNPG